MSIPKIIFRWIVLMLCPFVSLVFLFHQYQKPKVNNVNNLMFIEGIIKDYSFKYKPGGRAISRDFHIWIQGYDCRFQIPADYISYFDKRKFEKKLKVGDSIKISIPNENKEKLRENKNIILMSIDSKSNNYMSYQDTIAEVNTYYDIYAAIFFFAFGYGIYIFDKKKMFLFNN